MEPMPPLPDCHCHECHASVYKRQWESCLPAGLGEGSFLYGIFLLRGYVCLLIDPWKFWGGSGELG